MGGGAALCRCTTTRRPRHRRIVVDFTGVAAVAGLRLLVRSKAGFAAPGKHKVLPGEQKRRPWS